MTKTRLYRALQDLGLSRSYASQLARGVRMPGLPLAIHIWRQTGEKLGPVAGLGRSEIARLEHLRLKRLKRLPRRPG